MTGCFTPPKDLDLALDKKICGRRLSRGLVPPEPAPAINQMHSWKVKLATPDGAPVHGAGSGRWRHAAAWPRPADAAPRDARDRSGHLPLDGMKFSMTGWWEVKLDIEAPQGADKVTFNRGDARPPAARPHEHAPHGLRLRRRSRRLASGAAKIAGATAGQVVRCRRSPPSPRCA